MGLTRMIRDNLKNFFRATGMTLLAGFAFPGLSSAAPEDAVNAFRKTVAICEKPGIAPGNWLGELRAMGWREPTKDQIGAILDNLAEADVLGIMAKQGFAPLPEGLLERRRRFVTEVYETRQQHGLNEVYVLGQNTDRILRIGPERHSVGILLTEPLGGYCNVTFFGESADQDVMPENALPVPAQGFTLLLGGNDPLPSSMFFDPGQSGIVFKRLVAWKRSVPYPDPECILELANLMITVVFDIPECARRMD